MPGLPSGTQRCVRRGAFLDFLRFDLDPLRQRPRQGDMSLANLHQHAAGRRGRHRERCTRTSPPVRPGMSARWRRRRNRSRAHDARPLARRVRSWGGMASLRRRRESGLLAD